MKKQVVSAVVVLAVMLMVERASAAEFEKVGSAVGAALGTTKVFQKKFKNDQGQDVNAFYSKGTSGSPDKIAFVEKGLYNPGACTHTWVIGLNATTSTVEKIRVVEMSCTHAHPTKADSYTSQYKGKGPANVGKLKEQIKTIAKATGSSDLMTEAVDRSISNAMQARGKL